ncbi:hypothetical protein P152DRAFT_478849 [Eremomyces bilateralis CBS 781.70]|uniref:Chromosome segregation ATPase family protein n=1 Tax=Eremomyces bilateralis CBS 781.70 TaxID=1392243 RepID=A0A6G1GEJ0_9PEZI|nr:uncharacterized protein P152DRAFT_478849 [Eremomyces bilateralis CBS 781.70]KAF1816289.1 hypothetical protein P152DRAFT_478849 [Eremomyces bilateralis CBS 781.70]
MPAESREPSRDRDQVVKYHHQHSYSESGRASVPMWDSSDPDRAPPPLPLNPSSPQLPNPRINPASHIAAATAALQEKAREGLAPMTSNYITNGAPSDGSKSPERSLVKGAQHRRLQSLQTPSVKDLRSYLDGSRSPERSPDRATGRAGTPSFSRDDRDLSSPDKSRESTPTPTSRELLRDSIPNLRPTSRSPPKAILGEHTPPSATMLALQTIPGRDPDTPLANMTRESEHTPASAASASTPRATHGAPQVPIESISTQILGLTTIATKLQREMEQLSRRSRDNATDLVALKDATRSRDEDIRKSLRELVQNLPSSKLSLPDQIPTGNASRSGSFGVSTPPPAGAPKFTLPRIPSPASFLSDDRSGSPNPFSLEGAASVAMLEKIIREMVTKEGQERLLATLSQLFDKSSKESGDTARKVEQLTEFIRQSSSQALVTRGRSPTVAGATSSDASKLSLNFDTGAVAARGGFEDVVPSDGTRSFTDANAKEFVSDEVMKILRKIKDSVGNTGGLVAEVKAQQRDLRGEVLHMGRDLMRRIDEAMKPASAANGPLKAIEDGREAEKIDIARLVQEGLEEVKSRLDDAMRERRRQSSSSIVSRTTVDSREVYDVVKHALAERDLDRGYGAPVQAQSEQQPLDREAILEAVKEAYEAYKPEIELQQFGLERDEILQCLKDGLEDYRSNMTNPRERNGISKDEVMDAVHEAMTHFNPPSPINESKEIRDEVLLAVRECLDELRPAFQQRAMTYHDTDATKDAVLDAVKEGLASHGIGGARELELNKDDLFDAVRAGLEASGNPFGEYGQQVVKQLDELLQDMRVEFKSYSMASGRDTEQVLDAMKDGLESLRGEIEAYVDRSQDVTGKDEIIDTVRGGLENLRQDVQGYVSEGPQGDHAVSGREMLNYVRREFEHLHAAITDGFTSVDHHSLLQTLHQGLADLKSSGGARGLDGEANIDSSSLKNIQEELGHLRGSIATALIRSGSADKDDIIDSFQSSLETLRTQLETSQGASAKESLDAITMEIDQLRSGITNAVVGAGTDVDKESILEAIRTGLEEIRPALGGGASDELLEAFRGEFEHVRASIATGMARTASRADTDEVLDAVRLGIDDLRSHLEKKMDNPEAQMKATGDILDALNDGLDSLKTDVGKMVDKPVDMTVSYEILDTLKDGLSAIHMEISKLKPGDVKSKSGDEIILAEEEITRDVSGGEVSSTVLQRNDIEKMEVLLAQLQIKVEALDANIQDQASTPPQPADDSDTKKVDLSSIEVLLKDLQDSVVSIAAREQLDNDNLAKKEDTDAIETLLRNTKSKLDDLAAPEFDKLAQKEDLENVEATVRIAHEAVDALAAKFDDKTASKEDLLALGATMQDIKAVIEELKVDQDAPKEKTEDEVTKKDLDILGVVCIEIKNKIQELVDPETLPSKADLEQIIGLTNDLRESHEKMREGYETDIRVTAKAFDDRKSESQEILNTITAMRSFLEETKDDLKRQVEDGSISVGMLSENVKGIEETIGANFSIVTDIKELMETVTTEFEKTHADFGSLQASQEQVVGDECEKSRVGVVADLSSKLEEHFGAITCKLDEVQVVAEAQGQTLSEKAKEQEEILTSTKAMSDELRVTIDTLGATVTSLETSLSGITQKFSDDSEAVFTRVNQAVNSINDTNLDAKVEHKLTRDEVAKAVITLVGLQSEITENHPQFLVALKEIRELISTHFEQSRKAQEAAEMSAKAMLEESKVHAEELKNTFTSLPALLPPALLSPTTDSAPPPSLGPVEFDDSAILAKLDEVLASRVTESQAVDVQASRLEEIQKQVSSTAEGLEAYIAAQTRLITDGQETREKEAQEAVALLEKSCAEKEKVDAELLSLRTEKDSLLAVVETLRSDRDALGAQKSRMAADVASLETALRIRREELHEMDIKADKLERRILDGIMDHSRSLLIARDSAKRQAGQHHQTRMTTASGTRVASTASQSTVSSLPVFGEVSPNAGLAAALKNRPAARARQLAGNSQRNNPTARRIASLNQMSGKPPTGSPAYVGAASRGTGGAGNSDGLKRSHSVKNSSYARKSSWNGGRLLGDNGAVIEEANKENEAQESDEDADVDSRIRDDETASMAGTERRFSNSTTTGSIITGASRSVVSGTDYGDRRSSHGTVTGESELTYDTGSYLTGSITETDRRTSYGSTIHSTLGAESLLEEDEYEDELTYAPEETTETQPQSGDVKAVGVDVTQALPTEHDIVHRKDLVLFMEQSDSGLGSDIHTAGGLSGSETDYFRRAIESAAPSEL